MTERVTYETLREENSRHLLNRHGVEASAWTLPQIDLRHAELHIVGRAGLDGHGREDRRPDYDWAEGFRAEGREDIAQAIELGRSLRSDKRQSAEGE